MVEIVLIKFKSSNVRKFGKEKSSWGPTYFYFKRKFVTFMTLSFRQILLFSNVGNHDAGMGGK